MKMRKNILGIMTALTLMSSTTVFAETTYTNEDQAIVYSEEFPDAYIIVETVENKKQSKTDEVVYLDAVEATVFVEDIYRVVDGENTLVESRLLSKSEVDEIGVENFEEYNKNSRASNNRGKLTISFSGSYKLVGNGVEATFNGGANWSGLGTISSTSPAVGDDFIGVVWNGGHSIYSSGISGTYDAGGNVRFYESKTFPNMGRVWSFVEGINDSNMSMYMNNSNLTMKVIKNNLEHAGNLSGASLQYTHTFQAVTGTISINSSGPDFTLSNTPSQWSISCSITGIPY